LEATTGFEPVNKGFAVFAVAIEHSRRQRVTSMSRETCEEHQSCRKLSSAAVIRGLVPHGSTACVAGPAGG
jgi:hypothetical protein